MNISNIRRIVALIAELEQLGVVIPEDVVIRDPDIVRTDDGRTTEKPIASSLGRALRAGRKMHGDGSTRSMASHLGISVNYLLMLERYPFGSKVSRSAVSEFANAVGVDILDHQD